ncbi:MAG: glycoside hydrolase family 92 protein [Bacteroidales bacterium]
MWALAYPEYLVNICRVTFDFAVRPAGCTTGWHQEPIQTGCRQTNGLMLAATYNAGIRDFDLEEAYGAAYKNETAYMNRDFGSGKYDLGYLVKTGYIPSYDTTLSNGRVFNFGASYT